MLHCLCAISKMDQITSRENVEMMEIHFTYCSYETRKKITSGYNTRSVRFYKHSFCECKMVLIKRDEWSTYLYQHRFGLMEETRFSQHDEPRFVFRMREISIFSVKHVLNRIISGCL
jgi:hypothetical protein